MKRTHRKFTHVFKTEVVLEALKERFTLPELAKKLYLQPNQIQLWKKAFLSKATSVFDQQDQNNQLEEQQKQAEEMHLAIARQYSSIALQHKFSIKTQIFKSPLGSSFEPSILFDK